MLFKSPLNYKNSGEINLFLFRKSIVIFNYCKITFATCENVRWLPGVRQCKTMHVPRISILSRVGRRTLQPLTCIQEKQSKNKIF